ncbi:ABC transporter ATP-binding protein [Crossiella sp. CA198]|uniref:ABC transporter ATP-binding protein n=1 Tax=Crossiella sp. CA198 TaxID=3455607 RepID=UPI003F8D1647
MLRLDRIVRAHVRQGIRTTVLDEVSLHVAAGELVALRGASGAGKTTLLAVAGLLARPDAGTVWLAGRDTRELSEARLARVRREELGFVFQSGHLLPHLSAVRNVALAVPGPAAAATALAGAALAGLGLHPRRDHLPGLLSGGEAQRVALARALVNRPRLLLADEPTGNLDPATGQVVLDHLRAAAERGCAVLVVTHSGTVAAAADRRLHLAEGRLTEGDR